MNRDNVIIFGAGASADAGIPLLNNFVDTMWNYSMRGYSPPGKGGITEEDKKLFIEANGIRFDLERYNSRANFKLRNLEDVLSLLSFEAFAGGEAQNKYDTWIKAITRTIELSTKHTFNDNYRDNPKYETTLYHSFWDSILGAKVSNPPPALISFNYDLVLERTLWDYFHYLPEQKQRPTFNTCKINYSLPPYDFVICAEPTEYHIPQSPGLTLRHNGFRPTFSYGNGGEFEIPYLKLHGSLNWCNQTTARQIKYLLETYDRQTYPHKLLNRR